MLGDEARLAAHVAVDFKHRIGSLRMEVRFRVAAPWTVLFGASGSGKSTILRVVAGLERADEGRVEIQGRVAADSAAGVLVPGDRRPVRWAGQRAYLTPGRKVKWQIGQGTGKQDEVDHVLDHFNLRGFADLVPEELSGGERQMISVIRAAAGARGRVLLLDEPFAGLDAKVRDGLIGNLRSWLGDTPVVSVTHDVGEAFLLGAEVVRIAEGRVVGQGPCGGVLREERRALLGVLGE